MRKLEIDVSLTLKIIQNEHRLKELFNNPNNRNRNKTTDYKYYNTDKAFENENFSLTKIDNVQENSGNKNASDEKNIVEISSQKTMEIEKKESKKIIKLRTTTNSKSHFETKENKRNKTSKMEFRPNPFVNKIRNNPINSFKDKSLTKTPLNRNATSVKFLNIEKMITRFRENEEKINEWLKNERTKKELEQKRYCQQSPKINKRSKKINMKIKDNFLLRLQKSENEKQQKAELLMDFMKMKKMEEEMKQNNMIRKSRTKKINFSNGKQKFKTINKFNLFESKRKEKIKFMRNIELGKTNNFPFVSKFNKRSTSMAELRKKNYSKKNTSELLTRICKYSGEKKNIEDKSSN